MEMSLAKARWILAYGLAFVFIIFGTEKLVVPLQWIGFIPAWLHGFLGFTPGQWLSFIGVLEILIGILFLMPVLRLQQLAFALGTLHLLGVVMELGWNDTTIRDIGLLCMMTGFWELLEAKKREIAAEKASK